MYINYPITANYVADWGLKEAVREFIQNAIDAGGMEVEYTAEDTWIYNQGSFDIEALLLGNSVKQGDSIGKYGEGMKLAMLVLARLEIDHVVCSGNRKYKGGFVCGDFDQPTFCIEYGDVTGEDGRTVVRINKNLRALIDEVYKPQKEGIIDKDLYIQGLRVCELNNFEFGYNMPKGIVELDRDRRTVDISAVENYASAEILKTFSPSAIADLLFKDKRDVSSIFYKTTASQDKAIGKACAELVKGQRVSYSYGSNAAYTKVGYHFYNYAVNHGGAQKSYSANAEKLFQLVEKHKSKLRRDIRAELLKFAESL